MAEKIREMICDPLKCLVAFCTINFFMFGLCAAGYWNLDKKIDTMSVYILSHIQSVDKAQAEDGLR